MNIVLVEPEIPPNTGNIVRLCAVTNCSLHLVRPLGFSVDDKALKRAGLDYWHLVNINYYDSFQEVKDKFPDNKFYFATTKAKYHYHEVAFDNNDFVVFGKETQGLPEELLKDNEEQCIKIPMSRTTAARSLNLSNSVSIIIYEALRQQNFPDLS